MRIVLLIATLLLPCAGVAQAVAKPDLTLEVQMDNERGRVRFTLRNRTDHEIRLPEPEVQCRGKYGAWVVTEAPLPECHTYATDALVNPKRWIVLWSGGYLDRWVSVTRLRLPPDVRAVHGEYVPPVVSAAMLRTLRGDGVEVPQRVVAGAAALPGSH